MEEQVKERKQIKVSEILNDLENGLTRTKAEDFGPGSIEEKYGLTVGEVKDLFQHHKLWKRKTKRLGNGLSFDVIDDTTDVEGADENLFVKDRVEDSEERELV